eukprot:CAMPEP_0182906274 /NCGR_PEP_ID=MMETSP0034_2-20130328/33610_1 /TAXON_ID=156128 /ORGANISM="Nephroselmis pyriformis, Strain CCMP717" /LENGTH=52 /DNA_ID=CAMNT_0025041909 /DNA_START=267 /DNA_END=422 /DNA_ORIENTATION=-
MANDELLRQGLDLGLGLELGWVWGPGVGAHEVQQHGRQHRHVERHVGHDELV